MSSVMLSTGPSGGLTAAAADMKKLMPTPWLLDYLRDSMPRPISDEYWAEGTHSVLVKL
jgi:hypothetical protein